MTFLVRSIPTLRHIPGPARARCQMALTRAINGLCASQDLPALWRILAFPKLVLRGSGDPRSHPGLDPPKVVLQRLDRWERGDWVSLWTDAQRKTDRVSRGGKGKKGPRSQEDIDIEAQQTHTHHNTITPEVIDRMRTLIADGAPRKTINLLTSEGIHDGSDPVIRGALEALHPIGPPVDHTSFPGAVETGLPERKMIFTCETQPF